MGGEENEEDDFLVMIKGKGMTEEEVKEIRREQEGRHKSSDKNKKRNENRRVNRHHPCDGAERKLIHTNNITTRAGGEGPITTTLAPSSSTPNDNYEQKYLRQTKDRTDKQKTELLH